jgi:hypothetical protein
MGRGWEHFKTEGNKFIDPDPAELDRLEEEARVHADARFEKEHPMVLPDNPWAKRLEQPPESWLPPEKRKQDPTEDDPQQELVAPESEGPDG